MDVLQTERDRSKMFMGSFLLPLAVAILVSFITTEWRLGADIGNNAARSFLSEYYNEVSIGSKPTLQRVWQADQTPGFQRLDGHDETSFVRFYTNNIKKVGVESVTKVSSLVGATDSNQFTVTLKWTPMKGSEHTDSYLFGLTCTDIWAALPIKKCPDDQIKIDYVSPVV